jgi:hypothetical protein
VIQVKDAFQCLPSSALSGQRSDACASPGIVFADKAFALIEGQPRDAELKKKQERWATRQVCQLAIQKIFSSGFVANEKREPFP